MSFADLHIHALYGVDDGPKTAEEMFRMVDMAYADGTRMMCLTPHFHPGYFENNHRKVEEAFAVLSDYVKDVCPDLCLWLGNEMRYSRGCISWLEDGACKTLGASGNVLVDFAETDSKRAIVGGLEQLLNAGYTPILAHVERYRDLRSDYREIQNLRSKGVLLQVTAGSLSGDFGLIIRFHARKLVGLRMIDFVASDGHSTNRRAPRISKGYAYIARRWGEAYADTLCRRNPEMVLTQFEKKDDISDGKGK